MIDLPEQDFYHIEDLIRIWNISDKQMHHYLYEQKSLRLAILNRGSENLKCIKISKSQRNEIIKIFTDNVFSKSNEGIEWVSSFTLEDLCKESADILITNLLEKIPLNISEEIYFDQEIYTEILESNNSDGFRIAKAISLFENLSGDSYLFIASAMDGLNSSSNHHVIGGIIIDQLIPVITAAEKNRFESSEIIRENINTSNSNSDLESNGKIVKADSSTLKSIIENKDQLTTEEAALFLGYSPHTLRNSRLSGILADVKPPEYKKRGRQVVYEKSALEAWDKQFNRRRNTSEGHNKN